MGQKAYAEDGSRHTSKRERNYNFPADRAFLEMKKTGSNFRDEVENRVRTYRDDRRDMEAKNEEGQQQYAAPQSGHADQGAYYEANQDLERDQLHFNLKSSLSPCRTCRLITHTDEALLLEVQNNFLRCLLRIQIAGIDRHLRIRRQFIGIGNAGEFFDDPGTRLGIQALAIALFTYLHRCGHVHQNESAVRLDHVANVLAYRVVRRDGRANRDPAVLGNFRSHVSDATNVDVAMLLGEPQLG